MDSSNGKQELDRFDHIEVGGDIKRENGNAQEGKCAYCGVINEPERRRCRGCFRRLTIPAYLQQQDQEIEVDGAKYRRSDPNCPEDIRVLMDRVAKEGYSIILMQEWRYWRSTRHAKPGSTAQQTIHVPPPSLSNGTNSPWSWRDRMPNWTDGFSWTRAPRQDQLTLVVLIVLSAIGLIFRLIMSRSW